MKGHLFKKEKDNREDSQTCKCPLNVGGGDEKMCTLGKEVITWITSDSATGICLVVVSDFRGLVYSSPS